jgi:16S rRNA (guanine1516-N2)-methyltransferase
MNSIQSFYPSDLASHFCVFAADSAVLDRARSFSETLQVKLLSYLDVTDPYQIEFPFVFVYQGAHAEIIQTGKGAPGPVTASFLQGKTTHRLKFGGGKGQMIAKAVGLNKGVSPTILDATAGLAQDAFVLASLGCDITLLERSPIIAELVAVALNESQETEIADITSHMKLIAVNACEWLTVQTDKIADVIYLDPMYPHRDKTALVKKEMRLFHTLVGESVDDADLLEAALQKARYRVVVKRPRKGDTIQGQQPAHQILGKSCRYDIYPLQRLENLK